jgi:hypothetical protein
MMPTKTSVGPNEVVRLEVLRLAPPLRPGATATDAAAPIPIPPHITRLGESARGYETPPPAARLQHVLTEEVDTAEAEAPLLDSMAVKAPPRGGWHDPTSAADLAAYAAAVAFGSSCAIARVQLVAWPCKEYVLDNGQFRRWSPRTSASSCQCSSPWLVS